VRLFVLAIGGFRHRTSTRVCGLRPFNPVFLAVQSECDQSGQPRRVRRLVDARGGYTIRNPRLQNQIVRDSPTGRSLRHSFALSDEAELIFPQMSSGVPKTADTVAVHTPLWLASGWDAGNGVLPERQKIFASCGRTPTGGIGIRTCSRSSDRSGTAMCPVARKDNSKQGSYWEHLFNFERRLSSADTGQNLSCCKLLIG
jgi:hypothetical protein